MAVLEEIANIYSKQHPEPDLAYLLITNFSEWMQMVGMIIFIRALLEFQAGNTPETLLVWEPQEGYRADFVSCSSQNRTVL